MESPRYSTPRETRSATWPTIPTLSTSSPVPGALATGGRNTLATQPTNDFSLATYKDIKHYRASSNSVSVRSSPTSSITRSTFRAAIPGQGLGVNDVTSFLTGPNSTSYLNYLTPGNAIFNNPKAVFASNARTIALVAKFTF